MGTRSDHRPVKASHGHGDETNGDGTRLGCLYPLSAPHKIRNFYRRALVAHQFRDVMTMIYMCLPFLAILAARVERNWNVGVFGT